MEFKELYSLFENSTIHRLLTKKVTLSLWAFRVFAGTTFMALRIPVVSMNFSSCLIFWTIMVAVDIPFQVRPKIFDRPYLWDVWWISFLWDVFNF
jgi:hypothetical protein